MDDNRTEVSGSVERMTPEQEQSIRERHARCGPDVCLVYSTRHVTRRCDTAVVLAALDKRKHEWLRAIDFLNQHAAERDAAIAKAAAERRQYGVSMKAMLQERDAALAREQALAEALEKIADGTTIDRIGWYASLRDWVHKTANAALRQHEEATR